MPKAKAKTKATKPKPETIEKHVDALKTLANKHGGVLPSVSWMSKNGGWGSYHFVQRWAPEVLAKMKRKFDRGGPEAKAVSKPKAKARKASAPRKSRARKLDTSVAQPQPIDEFSAA